MNLRLYQKGDFDAITDCTEPIGRPTDENLILEYSVSLTVEDDGVPVACGGVIYDTETDGIVWLRLSNNMAHKTISLVRLLRNGLAILVDSFGFDRITARVKEDFGEGHRFARRFGFTPTKETFKIFSDTYRIYEL